MSDNRFNELLRELRSYTDSDLTYVARVLTAIGNDTIANVQSRLKKDAVSGLPDLNTITAAQVSFFDNWSQSYGKRPKRGTPGHYSARYKVEVMLWDVGPGVPLIGKKAGRNACWIGVAALLDAGELAEDIALKADKEVTKRPWIAKSDSDRIGADLAAYGANLVAAATANPNTRFGALHTVQARTYFPYNFISATNMGSTRMNVELGDATGSKLRFDKWDTKLPDLSPLAGNCVLHSRASKRGEDATWRTHEL